MEHPIFLPASCCASGFASGAMQDTPEVSPRSEVVETGPTCQAAECAGYCDGTLANQDHQVKGGITMAKKAAKGAKKKAAKKR